MATIKPNISLITSKNFQPQIKPKSLCFNRGAFHSLHTNFSSNPSNQTHQKTAYQYFQDIQKSNSSQIIVDRANDINVVIEIYGIIQLQLFNSPINQNNLQMVNKHVIEHFKHADSDKDPLVKNFVYYKEQIDKALQRSAENMTKFNKSKVDQVSKSTGKKDESLPNNPLEKIRLNRFCVNKSNVQQRQQSDSVESNQQKEKFTTQKETLTTFDNIITRCTERMANSNCKHNSSVDGLSNKTFEENQKNEYLNQIEQLQLELREKDKNYQMLQKEYTYIVQQYKKIQEELQKVLSKKKQLNNYHVRI